MNTYTVRLAFEKPLTQFHDCTIAPLFAQCLCTLLACFRNITFSSAFSVRKPTDKRRSHRAEPGSGCVVETGVKRWTWRQCGGLGQHRNGTKRRRGCSHAYGGRRQRARFENIRICRLPLPARWSRVAQKRGHERGRTKDVIDEGERTAERSCVQVRVPRRY